MFLTLAIAAIAFGNQVPAVQRGQTLTLDAFLKANPWNPTSRGPMLVVDARAVIPVSQEPGFAAYGRQEMKAGAMTAIAPTEMVLIDASLKDTPDLYDGLPRKDKVLYLASLLNANQWGTASTTGIGMGDLDHDQQAVFRSILPSEFTYSAQTILSHNSTTNNQNIAPVTLTSQEESGVRLHFFKSIALGVRMANNQGYSAVSSQIGEETEVGQTVYVRENRSVEDKTTLFGVKIRKILLNALKPSDLNYKSHGLDAPLTLVADTTVADLCKAASSATGLTVLADVRLGGTQVQTAGSSARTGDVLQALALGMTCTFRKVGDVYVLTGDIEGLGTKKMKLGYWDWDLLQQTRIRSEDWKAAIRSNGGIRKTTIPAKSRMQPNDAMTQFMATDWDQGDKTMPASDLPQVWQDVLKAGEKNFGNQGIRTDVAEPWEEVFWCFVLPSGQKIRWEGEIGDLNEFTRVERARGDYSSKTVVKPIDLKPEYSPALVYATEDASVAAGLPELAKSHGFQEVWIHTWKPACLAAAMQSGKALGLPVRLVMEPWEIPPGTTNKDPDRNMMGLTFKDAMALQNQSAWSVDAGPIWGFAPIALNATIGVDAADRDANWKSLLSLAATPDLTGVVLVETEPTGYEPTTENAQYEPVEMSMILNLGFSTKQREEFLLQNMVDPVDFIDTRYQMRDLDLGQPPFGDPSRFGFGSLDSAQPKGMMQKWMSLLSGANLAAIKQFASQIPCPVLFQTRRTVANLPRNGGVHLAVWSPNTPLPIAVGAPEDEEKTPASDYWLWQFVAPLDPKAASRDYDVLTKYLRESKGKTAIDLRSFPPDQIGKMMDLWFKPASP